MIKFYIFVLLSLIGLSYGQMTGILPSSEPGIEADWISLGLISLFFIFLFTIYRHSRDTECEYGRARQRDDADSELSNKE